MVNETSDQNRQGRPQRAQAGHPYKKQIRGARLDEVYRSVEVLKREYLILRWLHLYVGNRGKKVAQVVGELYRLYPAFKRDMARTRTTFPIKDKR